VFSQQPLVFGTKDQRLWTISLGLNKFVLTRVALALVVTKSKNRVHPHLMIQELKGKGSSRFNERKEFSIFLELVRSKKGRYTLCTLFLFVIIVVCMVIFILIVMSYMGECLIEMEEIPTFRGIRDTLLVVMRLRVIIDLSILMCLGPNME